MPTAPIERPIAEFAVQLNPGHAIIIPVTLEEIDKSDLAALRHITPESLMAAISATY